MLALAITILCVVSLLNSAVVWAHAERRFYQGYKCGWKAGRNFRQEGSGDE